ncbi:MAG: YciI family protein [Gemmatimonadetes bacterium]|nr:YciI family protein [Gemmatimonadota bacterium]
MATFMLLLFDDPTEYADMSPDQLQAVVEKYMAWSAEMGAAGRLQGGHKLRDEGGRIVRSEGGAVVVRDGPYAEVREVVSGYFLIEAADYADAVAVASTCPHAHSRGSMHVREIEVIGPSQ